jgi:hypothetical protein
VVLWWRCVYSCGFDDTHQLALRDYIFSRNYQIYLMARFTNSPMFLFLLNPIVRFGEGIRIRLWNTSNEIKFHKRIKLFTEKLKVRGNKILMIGNILSEINFKDKPDKLKKKIKCENTFNITFIYNVFVYSCGFDDTQLVLHDYIFSRNYKIYLMACFTNSLMFLFLLNPILNKWCSWLINRFRYTN